MATKASLGDAGKRQETLIEMLRRKPDETACQNCLSQLDDYVTAQLTGQDYLTCFPEIAAHLDACPACAGAYARLYELELAAAADGLPEPEELPEPDLSFLLPDVEGPVTPAGLRARVKAAALAERLRAALHRTGNRLTLRLSADLLSLLRPSPAVAPVRAPTDTERYGEPLLILEPDVALQSDLPLTLTAYRDAWQPEECLVEVVVKPPGRSWPDLEGISVTLVVGGERRQATTDAWGLAAFEGIPVVELADMTVEVILPE